MAQYNGWTIVAMPAQPAAPASFEFTRVANVAANTNPFTGQQQVIDWQASHLEASVSMPAMKKAIGAQWTAFFKSLKGASCVFQFPAAVCADYPNELTSDGAALLYWRLKGNPKWSVRIGRIYGITFEIREAT